MNALNILTATQVGPYRIELCFDDGTVQTVDFHPFLARSLHPDIRAFLAPERFAAFRLEHGELVWGDYDLCFPIADLYGNQIDHRAAQESAA